MSILYNKIKQIPKSYFTINDLKKVVESSDGGLKVGLSRLVKSGKIYRLVRGYYTTDISSVNWEQFGIEYGAPSYLSFEWALGYYDILSQQAHLLTLATTGRNKIIDTDGVGLVYRHIQKKHFWGFKQDSGFLIAEPEKAFLDQAYLSLNGYAMFDIAEMDLDNLNYKKLKQYLKKFNNKKLNKIIKKVE